MKKILITGLTCIAALSMSIPAFASGSHHSFYSQSCDGGRHYTDANEDGICDYHCYTDADCDGVCDYYFDDNEDGNCDHCTAAPQTNAPAAGRGGHHGRGGCHHR